MTIHHGSQQAAAVLDLPAARPIDELECTAVLARHDAGRLAIIEDDEIDIFPVRYAVDGRWAIISVPPEFELSHASLERIALEVDETDADGERTIVVHGSGRDITAGLDGTSVRERRIAQGREANVTAGRAIRIIPRLITGRETPARTD